MFSSIILYSFYVISSRIPINIILFSISFLNLIIFILFFYFLFYSFPTGPIISFFLPLLIIDKYIYLFLSPIV
jgi:hypothetical protein